MNGYTMSEEVEGDYRLRIEVDMDGEHADPADCMATEIIIPGGGNRYMDSIGSQTFQSEHDELYERGLGGAFGRYLRIFHGIEALPVYMYQHGNIALSASSFIGRAQHAQWDSGMIGWAYITKEELETTGIPDAAKAIEGEVQMYGEWMNGDVYGYIVEELKSFRKVYDGEELENAFEDEEWEEVDSCWGFIGLEHAETEGRMALEAEAGVSQAA